ncbi:hypothetical protein GQ55_8G000800 [Panicum hallii var. hallii]|uniref:Uncharacterized protein n=1 Tax=Panicum hallii var. hallii TaxID=1504633 RepID=A0A2T7CJ35_9POAL|nr:hypothetical protein GQ55_8G000800 [Panicum hallii var. hallii]
MARGTEVTRQPLSTASQPGPVQKVIRPADTKIILPRMPEGLYFLYSTNMWEGKDHPAGAEVSRPYATQVNA